MIAQTIESKNRTAALRAVRAAGFKITTLLSAPKGNPKVAKNGKVGVMAWPMHLAPASLSGRNVCPASTEGCRAACLHTAGNPAYMKGKARARLERTRLFWERRDLFMALLHAEIALAITVAARHAMQPAFRLNCTSDIRWEKQYMPGSKVSIVAAFPMAEFYDYTKIPARVTPANYTLTFSLAEHNDAKAAREMANGRNVAVVLNLGRNKPFPAVWNSRPVVNGDEHDFRPIDGLAADGFGQWIALHAKGLAIGDASGFVRNV